MDTDELASIMKARQHSTRRADSRMTADIVSCINLGRILVPVDFSPESRQAVRYGAAFAIQFHASLILLHVVELLAFTVDVGYGPVNRLVPNEMMLRDTTAKLKQLKRRLARSGLKVELAVRSGVAHSEIVLAAASMRADLIVMGTRGVTGLDVILGSTTEKVVHHAPCPVMVVRRNEHEFVLKNTTRSRERHRSPQFTRKETLLEAKH